MTDLASATAMPSGPQFTIGRSLSMMFGVLGRNFVSMMTIAVIVTAAQGVIEYFLGISGDEGRGSSFLNILSYGFITAPVTYATFLDLRGARRHTGAIMQGGFRRIGRVMGASLAIGVVMVVAVLLTLFLYMASRIVGIIAGIAAAVFLVFIFVSWFVVVPVLVVEDVRFFAAFRRAAELSRDRRWGLLGLLLVYGVMLVVVMVVLVGIAAAVGAVTDGSLATLLVTVSVLAFYSIMGAILPAVVYYLLRSEKEGIGIDEIAGVFD